jgi:Cu/Ag efflux protein CusF
MFIRKVISVFSLLVLTACAPAYKLPPLTTEHPAHPEAMAAPEQPRSNTLSYGPSDIPSPQPAYSIAQRGTRGTPPSESEIQQSAVGEGKVIAVVPSSNQLVLDHEEIKGFMDAMTMGYRVDPPSLLEGLKAGDTIRFTIDTQNKAIIKIERLKK